jgi:hypothetical protein
MSRLRASFLGLHLALLALAMQLAAASLVVSPLLLVQADPTICHTDAAHAGAGHGRAGQAPAAPHVPASICPLLLAFGLAAPVLTAPPALLPAPVIVARRAAPLPPARAPPLHRVAAARPRGPPVQV